jgi:hypothetical protein
MRQIKSILLPLISPSSIVVVIDLSSDATHFNLTVKFATTREKSLPFWATPHHHLTKPTIGLHLSSSLYQLSPLFAITHQSFKSSHSFSTNKVGIIMVYLAGVLLLGSSLLAMASPITRPLDDGEFVNNTQSK